ncbi:MAG: tRNA pseudouridine(55) synthase TruB [Firmicutes bacterium]|nr:tRNA pseudouridine(55) synthase TruB [Bacillota bacterium]
MTGVINVYKEKGYTSHDVVAIIRRVAGTKKVGHTGTLDPDAAGVLPICLGRATKLSDYLASEDKTYIAEVILGIETDTGDISGEIISKKAVDFNTEAIEQAVLSFHFDVRGKYMQVPPMYSAIKIGGKKLYELARKGEIIDRSARPVVIHDIKIVNFVPNKNAFTIEVKCSKGTYIRSLATDIGQALGCGATMGELVRTQSGMFSIRDAMKLDELKEIADAGRLAELILSVDKLLPYPQIYVTGTELTLAKNGNPLPLSVIDTATAAGLKFWVCGDDRIIGLYAGDSKKLRAEVMM